MWGPPPSSPPTQSLTCFRARRELWEWQLAYTVVYGPAPTKLISKEKEQEVNWGRDGF